MLFLKFPVIISNIGSTQYKHKDVVFNYCRANWEFFLPDRKLYHSKDNSSKAEIDESVHSLTAAIQDETIPAITLHEDRTELPDKYNLNK